MCQYPFAVLLMLDTVSVINKKDTIINIIIMYYIYKCLHVYIHELQWMNEWIPDHTKIMMHY